MDDEGACRKGRARTRLDRIERRRAVAHALRQGTDRHAILSSVDIDEATLDRLAHTLAEHPLEPDETAEEMIVRTVVERLDRRLLIEALGGLEYDADPTTYRWSDLLDGVREGWLSQVEVDEVSSMRSAMILASAEGWTTPVRTAATMQRGLADDDEIWVFRTIMRARSHVGELLRDAPDLDPAWQATPAPVETRWDVLLAALVGHEFEEAGIEPPIWTAARRLETDWVVNGLGYSEAEVRHLTPPWLAERRIFIAEHDLKW